jgi:tetratricopeptide (TPR) repeat protein
VEPLLRELDIFLQLEQVEGATATDVTASDVANAEGRAEGEREAPSRAGRRAWIPWVVAAAVLVVVAVVLYLVLIVFPAVAKGRWINELRNHGQSYMVDQQYCKALEVYTELLRRVPQDPEAINGVENAKANLYDEASTHRKANELEQALEDLRCIFEYDPAYKDVRSLIETLEGLQAEEARCGKALDSGDCREAVDCWEKLRAMGYNPGTVSDDLYRAYECLGQQLIELVGSELKLSPTAKPTEPSWAVTQGVLDNVLAASRAFGKALNERPNSEEAKLSKALANSLKQGLERYSVSAWAECIPPLMEVYRQSQDPRYHLSGKVAKLICDAHLHLGDLYYRNGDYQAALKEYQAILEIQGCDAQPAQTRAQEAGINLTPSPTPTLTPTFTATHTATATRTPRPTATATSLPTNTPTPTPVPTTSSGGGHPSPLPPSPTPEEVLSPRP